MSREDQELVRREEEARRQAELDSPPGRLNWLPNVLSVKSAKRREREAEERAAAYAAQEAAKKAQASAQQQRSQHASSRPKRLPVLQPRMKPAKRRAAEAKARSEEAARAHDLEERRRKALAEAEAIRAMMAAPRSPSWWPKSLRSPSQQPSLPQWVTPRRARLHKPAVGTGTGPRNAGAAAPAAPGGRSGKEVKSGQAVLQLG